MAMQVRLQQLHDARILLMNREEERARRNGQPSPFGSLLGGEIIVKDPELLLAASEAGRLSLAAKTGAAPAISEKPKRAPRDGAALTDRVLAFLGEAQEPMKVGEIAKALPGWPRKRYHNAVSNMRIRGLLVWDGQHRYSITKAGRKKLDKAPVRERAPSYGETSAIVAKALADGPKTAGEIVAAVIGPRADIPGQTSKAERDRVYAAVHALKKAGKVARQPDGLYRAALA